MSRVRNPSVFYGSSLPADLPTPAEAGASRRREPRRRQGRPRCMEHLFVFETFWIGEALALRGIAKASPVLPS